MKRITVVLLTAALTLSLCACGGAAVPAATPQPTPDAAIPTEAPTATPAAPETSLTVNIYRGDDNAEYVYAEQAAIPELTPEALMAALKDAGVFTEDITVNSFSYGSGDCINLDLGGAFASQLSRFGTAGEYIMMGSLVNTFLDAYGVGGMYVTVDGSTLESGHAVYDGVLTFYERP